MANNQTPNNKSQIITNNQIPITKYSIKRLRFDAWLLDYYYLVLELVIGIYFALGFSYF